MPQDTAINPDSLGFLINDLARLMRCALEREIESAAIPVTTAEARVLAHMARCGDIRQHQLAERLGMAPMSLTGFLDRLERAGLVARGCDPKDRRAKIVSLTDTAPSLLAKIAQAGARASDTALSGLDMQQSDVFMELAKAICTNLDTARSMPVEAEDRP
ncbi:MarR family transcriptional regulator [Sulfitobacter sp. SK012]|uniref:MarR family winged helix-turn-helix transcriptional regulator n=1 Tax=Sulfitobacter sp. SK012 TaxID=1389005 RepID=UPI000E0A5734|nr:MarR family winged helix-turn-helix transcriptional regulator [Sulfitobacter sp. SK012]AXI44763.1 MarR family transcriptional regulator [Sulfitobacter sp. SK012]